MTLRNDVDSGPASRTVDTALLQKSNFPDLPAQWPGVLDPLSEAVVRANRARDAQEEAELAAAREELAAKNKLAQEALLADPASMRKQFPSLMADMEREFPTEFFHNGLNLDQIKEGLKDNTLSQEDKNLLTVFKEGFNVLNVNAVSVMPDGTHPMSDMDSVDASSLAMIDKAVNRDINEDPYFKVHIIGVPLVSALSGAAVAGAVSAVVMHDKGITLMAAGAGAAVGIVLGAGPILAQKFWGREDDVYDPLKSEYLAFTDAFHQSPPVANQAAPVP